MAGSWREAAALAATGIGYFTGHLLLARLLTPRALTHRRWLVLALPALGALVGAMYVAISRKTGVRPIAIGAVVGGVNAWLAVRRSPPP